MITERRIFQARTGEAGAVLAKCKEAQPMLEKVGYGVGRLYTDFYSGRTDRVVWEFDHESLDDLESLENGLAKDAELVKAFNNWFTGLKSLIEGATVELWRREK
ncbi:MAG: hypothetical protein ACYS0I_14280 [Planctomycetota bacterium]|jgi:hypothetical protein